MAKEWTLGEKDNKSIAKETEYAVLVGVICQNETEALVNEHLDELEFLALTAGAECIQRFTQKMTHPDPRTFIGKGKLDEIREYIERHEQVNMVILDDDLSGKQVNILEEALKVKIIDRSSLILDIFARRAPKAQAKTQ